MTRPKCHCKVSFHPKWRRFHPRGLRGFQSFDVIKISPEEIEALRLKNIKGLSQTEAANKMSISQSSFQRILASAYKKTSEALIQGKPLEIAERG